MEWTMKIIEMWLGPLGVALGLFLSPVTVAVCRRKSTRLTAVFGGLAAGLGCLFTSFAVQMHQVFLSYGFIMPIGLNCARVASSLMIGQYFRRRRERVEVVAAAGTGAGVALFSYCFPAIIRVLGWRLGLHAVTGLAVAPFFLGICFRSASLYHPQRRAIQHLKHQRRKIKDKSGASDRPPCCDWAPLRNGGTLVAMLAAGLCGVGLYSPFFHLANLVDSLGLDEACILQLQLHLGSAYAVGCGLFGLLLVRRSADCIVSRQYLCQAAMLALGLSFLVVQTAQDLGGFVLFSWTYGVPCGGLHYSLKMLVFEKIRAKSFGRAWAFVEWAQSLPVLLGVPATGYMNQSHGPRSGFYLCAAFSFAGAAALSLNALLAPHPPFLGSRRAQGSCSTCASQSPSQDFNNPHSRRESYASHPKCQKTISFSDTVDVADADSPRRHPLADAAQATLKTQVDAEEDVDADALYDGCLRTTVAVIERGDEDGSQALDVGGVFVDDVDERTQATIPLRRMAVIEEVTSSV